MIGDRGEPVTVADALADSRQWRAPDEIPDVPSGENAFFWVAVRRSNGHVHSFPANYLNRTLLYNEWDDDTARSGNRYTHGAQDEDEGAFEATGWHSAKESSDYDGLYAPLLATDDELIAWREVAAWTGDVSTQLATERPEPLATQIADAAVRSDIECYAHYVATEDGCLYDTSRLVDGPKPDPTTEAADLATIQRALRYIQLRGDALPFVLHRNADDPHLVWFEDRPVPAPMTAGQRMAHEYAEAASRG